MPAQRNSALLGVLLLACCQAPRVNPAAARFDAAGLPLPTVDAGSAVVPAGPVAGFADFHIHQLAEYGYAGAWYWGSHSGPAEQSLPVCSGGDVLGGDHARTVLGPLNEFLGQIEGSSGDTGLHFGKRNGNPRYDGWPRWDTIAHQTVWEGQLRAAHRGGLNLYLMSAVNFRPLCELMPEGNRVPGFGCDDTAAVERQLYAAWHFVAERDWVEIARSPAEARRIIGQGKLAMVLAVEISDLMPLGDWRPQVDRYHELGVRSIQFAHQLDNRFTGVAPHHWIFKFFELLDRGHLFDLDADGRNVLGLTADGKALARDLMDRGFIIDVAHVSERGVKDLSEISIERGYYPVNVTHGHLRSIMRADKQDEEKTTPDWIARLIRQTGGVFGLRSGPEGVRSYPRSGVANDCDGSTRSFAQAYAYGAQGLGLNIAFASDFNGFIQQLRPRFGNRDETCGAAPDAAERTRQQSVQATPSNSALDHDGFGHIGLEPEVLAELRGFGLDVSGLEQSAERVIRMWERCQDPRRSGPLPTPDFDTSGIQ